MKFNYLCWTDNTVDIKLDLSSRAQPQDVFYLLCSLFKDAITILKHVL
jgi:hypothetical protein